MTSSYSLGPIKKIHRNYFQVRGQKIRVGKRRTEYLFHLFFQTFCLYEHRLQPVLQYNDIIHMFIEKSKLNKTDDY